MHRTILIFGSLSAAILLLTQLTKYSLISGGGRIDTLSALIVAGLIGTGILIHYLFSSRRSPRPQPGEFDPEAREHLGLSERQYEVLVLMAKGLSNREIGDDLFISEHTVKSHVSQILSKFDARRRSQAIARAREMGVIH